MSQRRLLFPYSSILTTVGLLLAVMLDNVLTARSIVTQCGIFAEGGIMEGPAGQVEIVPRASATSFVPFLTKPMMVQTTDRDLRLRLSIVGFSMGIL